MGHLPKEGCCTPFGDSLCSLASDRPVRPCSGEGACLECVCPTASAPCDIAM
jgi:hypothetical protein